MTTISTPAHTQSPQRANAARVDKLSFGEHSSRRSKRSRASEATYQRFVVAMDLDAAEWGE